MKSTLKLVVGAFVAGFLIAGYKMLENRGYEWARSTGTAVETVGTLRMIGEQEMGYRGFKGDYTINNKRLCLSSQGQNYLLIFGHDSDLSELAGTPSVAASTAEIQGKSISYSSSAVKDIPRK